MHSFRILTRNGVPGRGLPFLLCIRRPIPKEAVPEPCPEHGNKTLKTEKNGYEQK